jgi:hypothetical protein
MRKPTNKEITEIAYALLERSEGGVDDGLNLGSMEQYKDEILMGSVGVTENYSTSSPGYHGPVFVVVWSAGPNYVTTLTRNHVGTMQVETHAE